MRRATMYGRTWSVLALITIGAATFLGLRAHPGTHPGSLQLVKQTPSQATRARLERSYEKLPLAFIANRGQLDRRVAYYVPGRDKSLYFTAGGVTFALAGKRNDHRRPVLTPASFSV